MSVINKMLRDLDQRQPSSPAGNDPLRRHTASVTLDLRPRRPSSALRWAKGLLPIAVFTAGSFLWWSFQNTPTAPTPLAQTTQVPAQAASAPMAPASGPWPRVETQPAALAVTPPLLGVPPPSAPVMLLPAVLSRTDNQPSNRTVVAAPKPLPAVSTVEQPQASSTPTSVTRADPALAVHTVAKPAPAALDTGQAGRQQLAARETLAEAQAMWTNGARDTAISTLHEAIATAERAAGGVNMVPMMRELARMELAEGRPSAVWELLTRMEPLMANQPELWALRANAAQRLGRHQDSVHAYTTALQFRPSEQRWLLGAAVSLAALGQVIPATEMAGKARSVGPVSREVLAYLRQQGVALID